MQRERVAHDRIKHEDLYNSFAAIIWPIGESTQSHSHVLYVCDSHWLVVWFACAFATPGQTGRAASIQQEGPIVKIVRSPSQTINVWKGGNDELLGRREYSKNRQMYPSIMVHSSVLTEQLLLVNTRPVPSALIPHPWIHLHGHSSVHRKSRGPCEYQTCPLRPHSTPSS